MYKKNIYLLALIVFVFGSFSPVYASNHEPDLAITNVTLNPTNPDPGETFDVNVSFANQSATTATKTQITIDVYIDGEPAINSTTGCPYSDGDYSLLLDYSPSGLAPGGSDIEAVEITGGLPGDSYDIWVFIVDGCNIEDTEPSDNLFGPIPVTISIGKVAPSNVATGQSLSPTLLWQSSPYATSYEYCYSSVPDTCTNWVSVGTNTSVNLSGLASNYTYYWQVREVNPSGTAEADGGSWWSFTTQTTAACNWSPYTPPASATFADVPMNLSYWSFVERLYNGGITAGCGGGNFCPSPAVNRAQMAIFLLRGKHCGISYTPPPTGGISGFNDVPADAVYAPWVKQLAVEGITSGCGNGNFCPGNIVNRASMAIFLLRAKHGGTYSPPGVGASTGFNDVPLNATYAPWVKQLAAEGVTLGCGSSNFCPGDIVNRASMAIFLVRNFSLP